MAKRPSGFPSKRGKARGFRSGLEERIAEELTAQSISFQFERVKVKFTQPEKPRSYTPDFLLANGVYIETKGLFTSDDRQKHLWIKQQHPELDIRFVFQNALARLSKVSKTTYAMWCDKHGFQWAHKHIPKGWLTRAS